jgi:phage shock protein A
MLNSKIEEAKRKKNVLIARKKRAEAQKAISETMSGLSDNSAFDTFNRMEEKINQLESEADAQAEVAEQYTGDALSQRFKELETNRGADMALEDLKRRMGISAPPAEAPAQAAAAQTGVRVTAQPAAEATGEDAEAAELERVLAEAEARRQNQRS